MKFTPRGYASRASGALALLALLAAGVFADDVTTTAGRKINGKLVAVDAQGITFTTTDAKVTIAARDIVIVDMGNRLFQRADKVPVSEVELIDGSVIKVAKYTLKGKKFETEQLSGPPGLAAPVYDLPMSAVFSVMKKADDPNQRAAWKKMLATRGKRDLYVIQKATGLDYVQGTILEGFEMDGAWRLSFESEDAKKDTLLQSRAVGLVFHQPPPATIAPTLCHVVDVYDNRLNATAIAVSPEGVTVTTVSGATVKYPSTAALVRLDYALGNVAYLSDLQPQVEGPEVPPEEKKLNPTIPFLKDRSLSNDAIKLDNTSFPKGLVVAPDTVLTYNLNGGYTQFKATIGIDENGANATSAAKVTIEVRRRASAEVVVRDRGIGIAADRQREVFERFTRLDSAPSRYTTGVGLGLPMSRDLSIANGGSLTLDHSEPGHGSTFVLRLAVSR